VKRQNIELKLYQQKLGLSTEDQIALMNEASKAAKDNIDFKYPDQTQIDHLYGLMRAYDEKNKNVDEVIGALEKQNTLARKMLKESVEENNILRTTLNKKTL
jgi:hypothetical protein